MKRQYRKKPRKNLQLRAFLVEQDISMSELARQMFIAPQTLSTWFSVEMSEEQKQEIIWHATQILEKRVRENEKDN